MRRVSVSLVCVVMLALIGRPESTTTAWAGPTEAQWGAEPPSFSGTAYPITPTSRCPSILPNGLEAPFGPNTRSFTSADYQIANCWEGVLGGRPFVLAAYFSRQAGGGVAVRYGNRLVARILDGAGAPVFIRFTGDAACWMEQAGAYYGAVHIPTGAEMPYDEARRICPPPSYPPAYVLGLAPARYPFALFAAPAAIPARPQPSATDQSPQTLPLAGGGARRRSWSSALLAATFALVVAVRQWSAAH